MSFLFWEFCDTGRSTSTISKCVERKFRHVFNTVIRRTIINLFICLLIWNTLVLYCTGCPINPPPSTLTFNRLAVFKSALAHFVREFLGTLCLSWGLHPNPHLQKGLLGISPEMLILSFVTSFWLSSKDVTNCALKDYVYDAPIRDGGLERAWISTQNTGCQLYNFELSNN